MGCKQTVWGLFLRNERLIEKDWMGQGGIEMKLKMNLQHFADENTSETENVETTENQTEDEQENTTYTRSDVDREISKAVDKALKRREEKHQEELQKAIQEAIEEKERLSKLSEKERKDEELSKREKELQDRLAEIERKELKADAITDLNEKGLPSEFADILLGDDAETTLENINTFKTAFDSAVNAAVKEKLRQDTPKTGGASFGGTTPSVAELAQESRIIK